MLLWSRAKSERVAFETKILDFHEAIQEIINPLKPIAESKKISIDYLESNKISFMADVNMFQTIIRNLVSNAIKFTNQSGTITIHTKKMHPYVKITIEDNGTGIDPINQPKLFDSSSLFTTPGTDKEKGTGLGLSLCKNFVEKHGGKIWVESEMGVGSKFHFTLPLHFPSNEVN